MIKALLEKISKAGGQDLLPASAPFIDREALAIKLGELKAAGHAIIADEVFETGEGGRSLGLRICHYLSCKACQGDVRVKA